MSLLASDDPLDPFMINCIPFTSRCNFRMVNEEVAFLVAIKIGWKDYYSRIRLRCNFLGVLWRSRLRLRTCSTFSVRLVGGLVCSCQGFWNAVTRFLKYSHNCSHNLYSSLSNGCCASQLFFFCHWFSFFFGLAWFLNQNGIICEL